MIDAVIISVILLIVAAAGFCIYKSKKSGKKCIGCPDCNTCGGNCCMKK